MAQQKAVRYWADRKGKLEAVFSPLISKEFPMLKVVHMLYTYRSSPKLDEDGRPILAEARKCSTRERDVYGFDFEICVWAEAWKLLSKQNKHRAAWHELRHCFVETDEDNHPAKDKQGRIVIYLEPHNLIIKSFKEEVNRFGLAPGDVETAKFLFHEWKKRLSNKEEYDERVSQYEFDAEVE